MGFKARFLRRARGRGQLGKASRSQQGPAGASRPSPELAEGWEGGKAALRYRALTCVHPSQALTGLISL